MTPNHISFIFKSTSTFPISNFGFYKLNPTFCEANFLFYKANPNKKEIKLGFNKN